MFHTGKRTFIVIMHALGVRKILIRMKEYSEKMLQTKQTRSSLNVPLHTTRKQTLAQQKHSEKNEQRYNMNCL